MERIGYILLSIIAIAWILGMVAGMVAAFPFGLIGLIVLVGIGLLFAKVVKDRINNTEDDYYSKNVDK